MRSISQNYDDLKPKESATPQSKKLVLEIKNLFVGKKKWLTIPIVVLAGLFFLPITILLLIGWLIYAKIQNKKLKIAGLSIIGLFILFFGWVYVSAIFYPTPPRPATKVEKEIVETKTSPSSSSTPTPQTKSLQAEILTVIDGDTIEVSFDNKKEVVRLIGINSPETVDPRKPVECFGKEASTKAKSLLLGKSVQLEADPTQDDRDKYQRLLRYVFLEDGTNFNKLMISEGYAYEYTYNIPYKYQSEFKQAQKEAEANKVGLWADNVCPTSTPQPSSTKSSGTSPTTTDGSSGSGLTCSGKTTCPQMVSCDEAKFYLYSCGVKSLDRDADGIPCETICKK